MRERLGLPSPCAGNHQQGPAFEGTVLLDTMRDGASLLFVEITQIIVAHEFSLSVSRVHQDILLIRAQESSSDSDHTRLAFNLRAPRRLGLRVKIIDCA